MPSPVALRSEEIRKRVGHPIVDADAHNLELTPVFLDFVADIGGGDLRDRFERRLRVSDGWAWAQMSDEERRYSWRSARAWWAAPAANTLDRATASLPRLMHERMDELGIDYAVVYPTWRPGLLRFEDEQDEEIRRVSCRALNAYHADIYGEAAERMTPAAMIPMHTPQEAIEELTYAVETLGLKVGAIASLVRRPIAKLEQEAPAGASVSHRLDLVGLDSDHDYDPFWAKCIELGVAPACHASAFEWEVHGSVSNYVYNHIGAFARAGEAFCKALFMGGVTRRFPALNVAFLEGGVAWACALYAGLVSHWEKRNADTIKDLDPELVDRELMLDLVDRYGNDAIRSRRVEIEKSLAAGGPTPDVVDDWFRVPMQSIEEIKSLFVEPFYFGCEADDPMNTWAFDTRVNPLGARLKAIFSSDIGHWDVPDIRAVVAESYELVEDGLMEEDAFRDFMFTNAVTLYGRMNPRFFQGTAVEAEAAKLLRGE